MSEEPDGSLRTVDFYPRTATFSDPTTAFGNALAYLAGKLLFDDTITYHEGNPTNPKGNHG